MNEYRTVNYDPQQVGGEVTGASGTLHRGSITIPVPVLKGSGDVLKNIRNRLTSPEFSELIVADFSDVAQSCNVYGDYCRKAAATAEKDFTCLGLALYGDKKLINKLTG
jgi:hypothetical protein